MRFLPLTLKCPALTENEGWRMCGSPIPNRITGYRFDSGIVKLSLEVSFLSILGGPSNTNLLCWAYGVGQTDSSAELQGINRAQLGSSVCMHLLAEMRQINCRIGNQGQGSNV